MKRISKNYVIELTEEEIDLLVTSLNEQYKAERHTAGRASELRKLRNDLAAIINRFFMGEDA